MNQQLVLTFDLNIITFFSKGLDSSTSYVVISLLRELADSGRTVVSVIHQPSSEIFEQFDRLIIMGQGNILYQVFLSFIIFFFFKINL